jgi:general secretion pathway protein E/type IV pilus assembly protein PilB
LRAILRQAPDTIMIGEIRDRETAEIALHAALTGHLVFSTLHTNDAMGAIARLGDLGVKPFLLSAALRGVLAQRLVRKICPHCRRPAAPSDAEVGPLDLSDEQRSGAAFARGAGCAECRGTGYLGRTGIFELLVVTDELQELIHARAGSARLRTKARARGLRTLRADGARKAIAGLTTIEEVVSITVGDAS